jgi:hypothetical protein
MFLTKGQHKVTLAENSLWGVIFTLEDLGVIPKHSMDLLIDKLFSKHWGNYEQV